MDEREKTFQEHTLYRFATKDIENINLNDLASTMYNMNCRGRTPYTDLIIILGNEEIDRRMYEEIDRRMAVYGRKAVSQ